MKSEKETIIEEEQELPCVKCKLWEGTENFCPVNPMIQGRGFIGPDGIMIVGQNPGEQEDLRNKVFIGPSGKLSIELLRDAGIPQSLVWITNAVKCRTEDNASPDVKHVNQCRLILNDEIEQIQPKVIVAYGAVALKSLTRKTGIMNLRGTVLQTRDGIPVIPTYHPSFVLRYPQHRDTVVSDLKLAKRVFDGTINTKLPKYKIYSGGEDLEEFTEYLSHQPLGWTAVDIETNTLDPWKNNAKVISIGVSNSPRTGWAVPLYHRDSYLSDGELEDVLLALQAFLEGEEFNLGFHNLKFDVQFLNQQLLKKEGSLLKCSSVREDTLLMHYLCVSEEESHRLKNLSLRYTDMGEYDSSVEEFFEGVAKDKRDYEDLPIEDLLTYNAADADATVRIHQAMQESMDYWGMEETYRFLVELASNLVEVEANGVKINMDSCIQTTQELQEEEAGILMDLLESQPVQEAISLRVSQRQKQGLKTPAWTFGSTQALKVLYFDVLKNPVIKRTAKKEPSLDAEVLNKYSSDGCVISQKILELRKVSKNLSMYGDKKVRSWIHHDGLVHPKFNVASTVTGRLSSSDPNYQNFPRDGKAKKMIVPRLSENDFFLEADYSQNELRGLCHYSKSPTLLAAFNAGVDVHAEGARQMFDYSVEDWDTMKERNPDQWKSLRSSYKTIVFGVIYGKGAKSLAEDLWKAAGSPACGSSAYQQEAEEKLELFFQKEPKVKSWIRSVHQTIRAKKFVRSRFGRVRRLEAIDSPDEHTQSECLRMGVNFILQSWSSDVTVVACQRVHQLCKEMNWNVWVQGTVHDSITCDGHKDHLLDLACSVRYIMERPPRSLDVPLEPSVSVGKSWGEVSEYDFESFYQLWIETKDKKLSEVLNRLTTDTWSKPPKNW